MFTGLVEGIGEITGSSRQAEGLKQTVALPFRPGNWHWGIRWPLPGPA